MRPDALEVLRTPDLQRGDYSAHPLENVKLNLDRSRIGRFEIPLELPATVRIRDLFRSSVNDITQHCANPESKISIRLGEVGRDAGYTLHSSGNDISTIT